MGKGIFENHCTYGHADASHRHVSQILTFKAWGMGGRGDHSSETHWEEKVLFLLPESIRIFSHLQVATKGISFSNSLDMQYMLNICILLSMHNSIINKYDYYYYKALKEGFNLLLGFTL